MSLLVKLSLVEPVRKDVYIRAHLVMTVERDGGNRLVTAVHTQIVGGDGQQIVLKCLDNPEDIVRDVNNALIQCPDPKAN